jgi:antitoxin YefM
VVVVMPPLQPQHLKFLWVAIDRILKVKRANVRLKLAVGIGPIVRHTCTRCSTDVDWMNIVSFSEARTNLKLVCDRVVDDADHTVIMRRDAPDVVVMSLESFNSLIETVHLLKSPANAAHLARSIEQFTQGNVVEKGLNHEN